MKATLPDGTLFEGTPEEFNAINRAPHSGVNGHRLSKIGDGNPPVWNEASVRSFWDSLDPNRNGGKQKRVLQFLIKRGGRATLEEVMSHLGAESGQELAGVLANITRNARRETGNTKTLVVDWIADGKGGCYVIPDGILRLLKDLV